MNIYKYLNYKDFIRDWVESKKELGLKVTFQLLATKIGVQKTYLSKVLNGDAHLNNDQAFALGEYMGLENDQSDFLQILIEKDRTALQKRRKILEGKVHKLQHSHLKTDDYLKDIKDTDSKIQQDYFLNSWVQVVHIALTLERYQKRPMDLQSSLGLSLQEFHSILEILEKGKFIETGKTIKVLKDSIHLPRNSPLFWSWYQQITSSSKERFRSHKNEEDLNFSVTFSANKESFTEIKTKILTLLEESQAVVKDSNPEELYQMNIDLGNWNI